MQNSYVILDSDELLMLFFFGTQIKCKVTQVIGREI